jgi:hypothetical protein
VLGSRKAQTTYYWNSEKEQIVCGCFKGTLADFKQAVQDTHGENEHAKNYLAWIKSVEDYLQSVKLFTKTPVGG